MAGSCAIRFMDSEITLSMSMLSLFLSSRYKTLTEAISLFIISGLGKERIDPLTNPSGSALFRASRDEKFAAIF